MQMKVVCEFGKLLRTAVTVIIKTLIKKSRAVFSDYLYIKKQDKMTRQKLGLCPQIKNLSFHQINSTKIML